MPATRKSPAIPSPGRQAHLSLLPAALRVAAVCVAAAATSSLLPSAGAASAEPVSATAPSAGASLAAPFAAEVAEASRRFGVPATWITAVMRAESLGDVRALSPTGAIGLMQIMPVTYAGLRDRYGLGADPTVPRDNILAGAAFLRELHDRYGMPGFLAAYNAGPARYEDHLATGRPLPAETRRYVAILAPMLVGGQVDGSIIVAADALSWSRAPLFILDGDNRSGDGGAASTVHSDRPTGGRAVVDESALVPQSDGLFVRRRSGVRPQ